MPSTLTDIYLGATHSQITYDPLGRMTSKQANGQTVFADANFAAAAGQPARPHAMKSAATTEGVFPDANQSIAYTSFDKVKAIVEDGNGIIINYGYDQQRIRMYEIKADGNAVNKDYVGVCEYVTESFGTGGGATLKTFTYLVGPYGVFAVVEHGDEERIHYILKDHLGSWTTITNAEGVVEQELSFDAWGDRRNPETWQSSSQLATPMFDRGFTGHEHLYAFGLINMNGRMYDPQMSSFLSVDAYVQSPDNSQSFNRYAYCLNNPLKYTDPSGWVMVGGMTPSNPFHENWGVNFAEHVITSHEAREILWNMGALGVWMEENEVHGGGGEPYDGSGDDDKNKKKNEGKSKQAKDAMNYTNGVATLVGGAAKNVSKESSFFKFFGVGCQVISYTGLVINAYNNWNKYDNSEITLYSFVARNVNSVGELALTYIPYGIGVPFSITITAVDICGGFDNNIYNEEWVKGVLTGIKEFVTPTNYNDIYPTTIYYRHGR